MDAVIDSRNVTDSGVEIRPGFRTAAVTGPTGGRTRRTTRKRRRLRAVRGDGEIEAGELERRSRRTVRRRPPPGVALPGWRAGSVSVSHASVDALKQGFSRTVSFGLMPDSNAAPGATACLISAIRCAGSEPEESVEIHGSLGPGRDLVLLRV